MQKLKNLITPGIFFKGNVVFISPIFLWKTVYTPQQSYIDIYIS